MTLMVALVGEQPLPNFLPVRYYQSPGALPEKIRADPLTGVLLIYTPTTESVYKRLEAKLKREKIKVYPLKTDDAYNIGRIIKRLREKLATQELASQSLIFNFTGGTKPMSLAAYQVAQEHDAHIFYMQSEEKKIRIFSYEWEKGELQQPRNVLLDESYMKLKDFFGIHLDEWGTKDPDEKLAGTLFQKAVAQTLCDGGYKEVMVGVKALGPVDIDVAVEFKNQLGIFEVKMTKENKDGKKKAAFDGIQQLHTAVKYIGDYTKMFYVVNIPSEGSHNKLCDIAKIKVISLTNYVAGTEKLPEEDKSKLLSAVDEVLGKRT